MQQPGRPDPDALLAAAEREGRGRLKIFLGAAPGVGKTWKMLAEGHRLRADGIDVVAGIIETHGRAETASRQGDLETLPRRAIEYRGQTLHEFDLDAALHRAPAVLLVDELAHTNAPGSLHAKRWEDVRALVQAGQTVWATLNVQHLESLNDDIARITGVRVTETLPDQVLAEADEIELIDLPPDILRARLREGRVYPAETARRALDGYFKEGNLAALREIALRRAAEHVDHDMRGWMRAQGVAGPWPASERILALIGPDAAGEAVIRTAKQLADALRAPWIALHIERPAATPRGRPSMSMAAQLGAEIETRSGNDLIGVMLEAARTRNVTQIVLGRATAPTWRRLLGRTLSIQLLRRAPSYALHIVPSGDAPRRRPRTAQPGARPWRRGASAATAMVAAVTLGGLALGRLIPQDAMGMLFLASVVAAATLGPPWLAIYTGMLGFLCWDFFFIPPVHTISISNTHDVVALSVFLVVAALSGWLAGRARTEADAGQARIDSLRRIASFSRRLGEPATEPELLAEIARQGEAISGAAVVLTMEADLSLQASAPAGVRLDEGSWAAARWAQAHRTEAGNRTATLPSAGWRFLPLRTVRNDLGVLGLTHPEGLDATALQAAEALADQAAIALERVRLSRDAAEAAASAKTHGLRTALLNSLSHDLRTPLTGIRGAAETLRANWQQLNDAVRADLLASIDQDIARMTRFLANITDMTRLEAGEIKPRLEAIPIETLIEAAVARVSGLHVTVSVPDPPPVVMADGTLAEQALVNVLENALKYAPDWSQVAIRVASRGAMTAISVADEGIGIAADALPHVFDSFYRARLADRVIPGTGLGLAIARGLLEAMGGDISAQSPRPDSPRDGAPGTQITLRLPTAP